MQRQVFFPACVLFMSLSLQTGRYLHVKDAHNNRLVSVMNMMGVEGTTFGDPKFCTGPLKGL